MVQPLQLPLEATWATRATWRTNGSCSACSMGWLLRLLCCCFLQEQLSYGTVWVPLATVTVSQTVRPY